MLPDNPRDRDDQVRPLTLGIILLAAALATVLRLLPYLLKWEWLFNITAIGALGLYGGARLRSWQAFLVPLLAMAASDVVIRLFAPFSVWDRLPVYASFLVYVLLGRLALARTESPLRIGGVALLGSLQFFLITNFAVFVASAVDPASLPGGAAWSSATDPGTGWTLVRYAANLPGLIACYALALPFAWKTVLGDLLFSGYFFGVHAWQSRRAFPRERVAAAPRATAV